MTFVLPKLAWILLQPSNLLLLGLLAGLLLQGLDRRRLGMALAGSAGLLLAAGAFLPLGQWLLVPLENRFPPPAAAPDEVDGIITLGNGPDGWLTAARGQVAIGEAAERFTELIALGRRYPEARLVFTGGSGDLFGMPITEADALKVFYERLGFDVARITFEGRSRNTWENVLFSRDLVQPAAGETWLLVTSAATMPRTVGVFRRLGWEVVPWPVDYRTTGRFEPPGLPDAAARLLELDWAVRQWLGLVAYWLMDRSPAIFPGPE